MRWAILILVFYLFLSVHTNASSSYVLPYPSAMPGSIFYKLNLIKEEILKYWYFGDFGQFHYNLKQSDKYLVEAKTLFEYKQYLLGYDALKRSNGYFAKVKPYLNKARIENKNIYQRQNILKEAALKHVEVLNGIKLQVPNEFIWRPEKSQPIKISLRKTLEESISIRKSCI